MALLSACAIGPDHAPPPDGAPARFRSASAGAGAAVSAETPWWTLFRDPDLSRLVETARAANPDAARARAAVATARAVVAQAAAGGRPTLDGRGGYTYGRQFPDKRSPAEWTARGGFDAGWELDLWGRHARSREAARARLGAAEAAADGAMLSLAGDVARALIELRAARSQMAVAARSVANRRRDLSDVAARARGGEGTALERLQAEAALLQAEALLPALAQREALALDALAVLCGQAPGDLGVSPSAEVPAPPPQPSAGVPAEVLRRRPDVRAAERELAAAVAGIGAAMADRLPSLSLGGSITLSAAAAAAPVFSLGPSLSVPFLDGGARAAAVDRHRAEAEEARLAHRAAVLGALREVEDAAARLREDGRRRLKLAAAARTAARASEAARSMFVLGGVEFFQVLSARQQQDALLLAAEEARAAEATDAVALFKALGGGYAAPPPGEAPR